MNQHIIIPFKSIPQPRPQLKRGGGKAHYGSQAFLDFKLKLTNLLRCKLMPVSAGEYPIYIIVKYLVGKSGQKSDVDNHLKIAVDCLVQSGILIDDNMNYVKGICGIAEESDTEMFEIILQNLPFGF
jgi:Holliday junction resolvase RusA-like endonuclease